jgi:hypothetical protein
LTVTHERLKELLFYYPETGIFRWRKPSSPKHHVKPGVQAGAINKNGYRYIELDGVAYRSNRLAWFYVHGVWPEHDVDHENGVKSDDRIDNLRDLSHQRNSNHRPRLNKNNKTGYRGVTVTPEGRFKAMHAGKFYGKP